MKKRGKLLVLIVVLLFGIFNLISAEESIFYKGELNFKVNEAYNSGETISSTITISNSEEFPIADATLVVDLIKGCKEPIYPSQASDCDNIINEKIINDINLAPKSNKKVDFSYVLPADLESGTYRLDVYLIARKAPIIGIPSILLTGKYKSFEVNGLSSYNDIKILRTKTNIKNQTGPIGVGVEKNENVNLEVYITSEASENAELFVKVCDWEDTTCKESKVEKTIPLSLIAGENKINVEFNAPSTTSAYPVRLEVSKNGNILSLYRSRIVVMGESAKIRKIYPDKIVYGNENAKVSVLVGPSPDHYNKPTTKNVKLTVKLTNSDGKSYEKSQTISEIASTDLLMKDFSFSVKELRDYEICGKIESSTGELYDSECYNVIASKFSSSQHLIELEQNFQENRFNGKICIKDSLTKEAVNTKISIMVMENSSVMFIEEREVQACSDLSFQITPGVNYLLKVYDQGTDQEYNFNIYKEAEKETIGKITEIKWYYWVIVIIVLILVLIIIIKAVKKRKYE